MRGSPLENYHAIGRRNGDKLHSHHSQKNSFINRPGKPQMTSTLHKKDHNPNKENTKRDKLEVIKKILESKESAEEKLELIKETVYTRVGQKQSARKELT